MKVSWDDEIPNIWENKIDVPNHQPDINLDDLYSNLLWYPSQEGFHGSGGGPKAGEFIVENPIWKWMMTGVPPFGTGHLHLNG